MELYRGYIGLGASLSGGPYNEDCSIYVCIICIYNIYIYVCIYVYILWSILGFPMYGKDHLNRTPFKYPSTEL